MTDTTLSPSFHGALERSGQQGSGSLIFDPAIPLHFGLDGFLHSVGAFRLSLLSTIISIVLNGIMINLSYNVTTHFCLFSNTSQEHIFSA
jgi:hypothetical protein